MKHCKKCGAQKADTDFYASRSDCKDCAKAAVRANYARNREAYREYERRRANQPHRVEARRSYQQTDNGRARIKAAQQAYTQRNPGKRAAAWTVDNAVRDKRLWKSPCCMAPGCFSTDRLHGHHVDYDKPLSVVWLCVSCHSKLHRDFIMSQRAAA
jgi:hypothetical protein